MFSFTDNKFSPVSLRPRSSGMQVMYSIIQRAETFRFSNVYYVATLILSELSLDLNCTYVNRVPFYTTQKIRNLSLFSELGSF